MTELKMKYVLILVIVAFMLYHLSVSGNGFSVGGISGKCYCDTTKAREDNDLCGNCSNFSESECNIFSGPNDVCKWTDNFDNYCKTSGSNTEQCCPLGSYNNIEDRCCPKGLIFDEDTQDCALCKQHYYTKDGYSCTECKSNPDNCTKNINNEQAFHVQILNACDGTGNIDTSACVGSPIYCHTSGCFTDYEWNEGEWSTSWWQLSDEPNKYKQYNKCKAINPNDYNSLRRGVGAIINTNNISAPYKMQNKEGKNELEISKSTFAPDQYYLRCIADPKYINKNVDNNIDKTGWYCSQKEGNKCIYYDGKDDTKKVGQGHPGYPGKFMTKKDCEYFKDNFCQGCNNCNVPQV